MLKKLKIFLPVIVLLGVLCIPQLSQAVGFDPYGAAVNVDLGQPAPGESQDVVINILNIVLGILALLAVVIIIIAGFYYMFSGGVPDKVKKAKDILFGAIIGLAIILASWGITVYVIKKLDVVTTYSSDEIPDYVQDE